MYCDKEGHKKGPCGGGGGYRMTNDMTMSAGTTLKINALGDVYV